MIKFESNQARAACGVKTCAVLPAFTDKGVVKKLEAIEADLSRLQGERRRNDRDVIEAEIAKRRQAMIADPSAENIAAVSPESTGEILKRSEEFVSQIAAAHQAVKNRGHDLMLEILAGLESALGEEIDRLENANRAMAEKYGIPYDREQDYVLKGLARFGANARARLDNQRNVQSPAELREFLGELKTAGLFD